MTRRGAIQTRRDDLDARRTRLLELSERLSPAADERLREERRFVSEPLTELLHRYASAPAGEPRAARPRAAPRRTVLGDQEGARAAAGEPAPLLRRAGAHPQHLRHGLSRRHPQRQRGLRRAGARLRRAVPAHRRTRTARGLRADDAAGHRAGPRCDPDAAPGGRAGDAAHQRADRPRQHRAGRGGVQPRHPADAARHPAQPDRGVGADRDRAGHLAAHRRGRARRQAGDPGPVRRHPAAAQPAGVDRAGGQGVDARRARRPQPVHVRLRGVGRRVPTS